MAYEKLLILESTWADKADYIRDSRSTARIYLSFESLQSLHDEPVFAVHRPLLANRYVEDIRQFVSLPANQAGLNVIILSAHGSFSRVQKAGGPVNRRRLDAIDGEVERLGSDIRKLRASLGRTVFILDACEVGQRVSALRNAAGCLAVIGFGKSVDWVDSAAFVLAVLLHMQSEGIFHAGQDAPRRLKTLLGALCAGPYKSLSTSLGAKMAFAKMAG